ncbi:MAG: PepSY domain-containing protein [Oscillospiraceae bacterium]|nr:PepSY domain-containing protein [Oscillospiraceae bacterium]
MKRKYISCFAALCIAASLASCSNESAPAADLTNSVTSAAQSVTVSENGLIGLEAAENAALAHAGISEAEATITKTELDRDNGNYEYEIEFTAKNYKYEYDINAVDGSVMSFSKKAVSSGIAETSAQASSSSANSEAPKQTEAAKSEVTTSAETQKPNVPSPAEKIITAEEAKAAALSHAGVDASEVTFTKTELDYDDGIAKYEIEFNSAANEYEYDINAATGMVIKYSKEALELPAMKNSQSTITPDEAKAAALKYAGLDASEVKFTKTELDYDDGVPEYEIEFRYGRKEYEFKIDAYSGEILEAEID